MYQPTASPKVSLTTHLQQGDRINLAIPQDFTKLPEPKERKW
ncbi:hypothetical protein [Lyngbya aestuarii]